MHRIHDYVMMYAIFCLHMKMNLDVVNVGEYTNHMDPDRVVWVPKNIRDKYGAGKAYPV